MPSTDTHGLEEEEEGCRGHHDSSYETLINKVFDSLTADYEGLEIPFLLFLVLFIPFSCLFSDFFEVICVFLQSYVRHLVIM